MEKMPPNRECVREWKRPQDPVRDFTAMRSDVKSPMPNSTETG